MGRNGPGYVNSLQEWEGTPERSPRIEYAQLGQRWSAIKELPPQPVAIRTLSRQKTVRKQNFTREKVKMNAISLFENPLPNQNRLPGGLAMRTPVLKMFHQAADETPDRMLLLKAAAKMIVQTIDYSTLRTRRQGFNRIKNQKFPLQGLCWCCGVAPPTERHHILQLQNGGSEAAIKNLVLLCGDCHEQVHPWMAPMPLSTSRIVVAKDQMLNIWEGIDSRKWNKEDARAAVKHMLDALYDKDVQPDPDIPVWRSTPPAEAQIIT